MEVSGQVHTPAALPPEERIPEDDEKAPEPVWTLQRGRLSPAPAENQTHSSAVHHAAHRYTDWADSVEIRVTTDAYHNDSSSLPSSTSSRL
jgi:hypothetical protein